MTNIKYIDKDSEIKPQNGYYYHRGSYWRGPGTGTAIYSVHEFVKILNVALNRVFNKFLQCIGSEDYKIDALWHDTVYPYLKNKQIAFFKYENGRLCLYILSYLRKFLASNATNSYEDETRKMSLGFSCNLFKYLKIYL